MNTPYKATTLLAAAADVLADTEAGRGRGTDEPSAILAGLSELLDKFGAVEVVEALRDAADAAQDHLGSVVEESEVTFAEADTADRLRKFRGAISEALAALQDPL